MLITFDHLVWLNNLNPCKCAVSSCVTSTPLNMLVTALDGRCDVSFCLLVDACSCLLRSNRVLARRLLSSVYHLVCFRGYLRRRCELAINYTSGTRLINRQGLYITYDPFYFNQRFAGYSRIGSMIDPTTCLQPLSNRYNHVPSQQTMYCYVTICSLLSPCLVCMLRMLRCYPVTPWLGISHYYYIIVDDMMIIIMLTIFDEGWKV